RGTPGRAAAAAPTLGSGPATGRRARRGDIRRGVAGAVRPGDPAGHQGHRRCGRHGGHRSQAGGHPMTLRLGTRGSALALAQSGTVADALRAATGRDVELVEVTTAGDRSTAPVVSLGVGVFVSALREALSAKDIDFAVHSYKDLPTAP